MKKSLSLKIAALPVLVACCLTACGGGAAPAAAGQPVAPAPLPQPAPAPVPAPSPAPVPVPAPSPSPLLTFTVSSAGLLDGNSTGAEQARDVARDESGNFYVVGGTSSPDFPVTAGAYDTTYDSGGSDRGSAGDMDVFVSKLDPQGQLIWSTYLGGPNYDRAYAVEVDAAHNVYVAGRAGPGFPTTPGVVQPAFAGDSNPPGAYGKQDGFVAKLSADGKTLLWATYFGDSGGAIIRDLDVDPLGRVHLAVPKVTGIDMDRFVTANAPQKSRRGLADSFYARLSGDGRSVVFGTYLGGNDTTESDANPAVRALPDGSAYFLTGETGSGAPTTPGSFQPANHGKEDMLLARFSATGQMIFCTYIGGSEDEFMDTHSLAVTLSGEPVISVGTRSFDYPVTDASAHDADPTSDVATTILSADGSAVLHSTLLGGGLGESPEGISVDAAGNVYITGSTNSPALPVTAGALRSSHLAGEREGFMLVYSSDLAQRRHVSYDGIPGEYANRSNTVAPDGTWIVVGAVWHLNPFPATAGRDSVINGTHAAFFRILKPAP